MTLKVGCSREDDVAVVQLFRTAMYGNPSRFALVVVVASLTVAAPKHSHSLLLCTIGAHLSYTDHHRNLHRESRYSRTEHSVE